MDDEKYIFTVLIFGIIAIFGLLIFFGMRQNNIVRVEYIYPENNDNPSILNQNKNKDKEKKKKKILPYNIRLSASIVRVDEPIFLPNVKKLKIYPAYVPIKIKFSPNDMPISIPSGVYKEIDFNERRDITVYLTNESGAGEIVLEVE